MTRNELNTALDTTFNDSIPDESLKPSDENASFKMLADYVDQQIASLPITAKTSGSVTLSTTPTQLPYDVNSCSFSGGIGYLPATTQISKEILVLANASLEIRANAANTNFLFDVFGTFTNKIDMLNHDMYRFTYIGFGGYWKAEKI